MSKLNGFDKAHHCLFEPERPQSRRPERSRTDKTTTKNLKLSALLLILVIGYLLYKNIIGSVFLKKKDRVNVVFYGQDTVFYSLGMQDVGYFFSFPANLELEVPGGYGYYRAGALGKLVSLEKKSDLFRKAFSGNSSAFVDLYFYPRSANIYYDEKQAANPAPALRSIFLYNTNANLFDRIILWLFFLRKPTGQFREISPLPQMQEGNRALFDREEFFKEYLGFFYNKTYRMINDRVQILYTKSYKTASLISNILEGEGIRVVDISEKSNVKSQMSKCLVIQNSSKPSLTANDLQAFFGCQLQKGETEVSDIILVLGDLEEEWSVE